MRCIRNLLKVYWKGSQQQDCRRRNRMMLTTGDYRVSIPGSVFSFPGIGNLSTSFPGTREWRKVWCQRHWLRQFGHLVVPEGLRAKNITKTNNMNTLVVQKCVKTMKKHWHYASTVVITFSQCQHNSTLGMLRSIFYIINNWFVIIGLWSIVGFDLSKYEYLHYVFWLYVIKHNTVCIHLLLYTLLLLLRS